MKNLILFAILLTSIATFAQVDFGTMAYGGTGCPAGSLTQLEIQNGQAQLLLDLTLEANGQQASILRKSCNVRLPMRAANGYQVGIRLGKITGFLAQDKKVRTSLNARLSFVGALKPQTLKKDWSTPINSDFQLNGALNDYLWTNCGGKDSMLSIDVAALTVGKAPRQTTLAVNDLNFDFALRRCK